MKKTLTDNYLRELINGLILSAILCLSVLYSVYYSDFAEMNIQFSFLDFPIFIGEILLALCISLLLLKLTLRGKQPKSAMTTWHYVFMAYCVWVLARALHGYWVWGPLALRNAALFYYPVFLFFTYSISCARLSDPFKFLALVLLSGLFFLGPAHGYFTIAYILLAAVLLIQINHKTLKIAGCPAALAVLYFSFQTIFGESRSNIVATLSTLLFIAVTTYILYRDRISKRTRLIIFAIIFVFCGIGLWKYADRNSLKSLVSPIEMVERFNQQLEYIKEKEGDFEFKEIQPKLYGENSSGKIVSERTATLLNHEISASIVLFDISKKVTETTGAEGFIEPVEGVATEIDSLASADPKQYRSLDSAFGNSIFRLLIWHDMFEQLWKEKAILGINFGKPQRSRSIEITQWAYGVWLRDGYITPHNSFLHVIYRGGIVGLGLLAVFIWAFIRMIKVFIRERSVSGCLMAGILVYWMMLANFLVVLELPYFAIPFWSLFGVILAYSNRLEKGSPSENPANP